MKILNVSLVRIPFFFILFLLRLLRLFINAGLPCTYRGMLQDFTYSRSIMRIELLLHDLDRLFERSLFLLNIWRYRENEKIEETWYNVVKGDSS